MRHESIPPAHVFGAKTAGLREVAAEVPALVAVVGVGIPYELPPTMMAVDPRNGCLYSDAGAGARVGLPPCCKLGVHKRQVVELVSALGCTHCWQKVRGEEAGTYSHFLQERAATAQFPRRARRSIV